MTATPIPRTMALTIYGDLDVSVLDELPPGRQPIKTVKIKPEARERAYHYVRDEVKKGHQAYVVCPLVEESEKLAHLKAASALAEPTARKRTPWPARRPGAWPDGHLRARRTNGTLPRRNARCFGFHHGHRSRRRCAQRPPSCSSRTPTRFGLSQLHQLRGRVGRGPGKSMCILLANPKTDDGKARLQVMTKTQNGFEIAEHDLNLRGPGEFYGTRQSGMPDLRPRQHRLRCRCHPTGARSRLGSGERRPPSRMGRTPGFGAGLGAFLGRKIRFSSHQLRTKRIAIGAWQAMSAVCLGRQH